ncbi:small oligopeptide transporter, OPT family [Aulographum hederae CBS 113979]|uniref:Small oligopeptide transporter, OPT family n=1 Tax=Aulographum hederae CBS 113979 TaxID=1176131 RepID=A0A6G1GP86_9PEZI|nr:small oligopeptide transporter, OPT family [Aulographum hederae CBS 113979]
MHRFRKSKSVPEPVIEGVGEDTSSAEEIAETLSSELPNYEATKAHENLKRFSENHQWDPNLEDEKRNAIHDAVENHVVEKEVGIEQELEENSPYPEVVAAVRNYDEDLPSNTLRAWMIGLLFTTIGSGLNMLFSLRSPQITITSIVAQLVSYPVGMFCAKVLPTKKFRTFGLEWTMNPGPFNIKEHALITIMANVTFGGGAAYSTNTIEALLGFYDLDLGWGFSILYTLSTQMLGFGLAGIFRRFLVYPAAMIWPVVLPNTALFYTLHTQAKPDASKTNGWVISRYRWFLYLMIGAFVWYWFPGFIWQGLSVFAFITWIKPNSVIVNQLFGGFTGLSLVPITFDWTYITAYILSPLIPPWYAVANTLIGLVVFIIITSLGIHYTGAWYSEYLPMSDSSSYDNTGAAYNVSRILTPEYTLDEAKYKAYSPLFLSTTFAICYGMSFAMIVAVIFHTVLNHSKEIWYRYKAARNQEDDIHMRMMKKYQEAPDWWFAVLFLAIFGMGMGVAVGYPTELTWWAYIIGIFISAAWFIPCGMVQAITNIQIGLNVFTEFIIGYMLPGRPIAMMCFKTYGYITMYQGLTYTQDLKLGHYMKLPPRTLFWAQGIATIWGCIVEVAVLYWSFGNINNICDLHQSSRFTCPNGRVFFNASIIWGVIGPGRMFSPGSIYVYLQFYWLIGAALPIAFFLMARKWPNSIVRYLNAPVIFGGVAYIPPATPLNYLSWGLTGFVFNKVIRSRFRGWWLEYNYVTSAALDSGLALCTILIFFALQFPQVDPPDWWGNRVVTSTMDYEGTAVQRLVAEGETFGPTSW